MELGYVFWIMFAILCVLVGMADVMNGILRRKDTVWIGLSILSVGFATLIISSMFYYEEYERLLSLIL
jgi:hypothetical protein